MQQSTFFSAQTAKRAICSSIYCFARGARSKLYCWVFDAMDGPLNQSICHLDVDIGSKTLTKPAALSMFIVIAGLHAKCRRQAELLHLPMAPHFMRAASDRL